MPTPAELQKSRKFKPALGERIPRVQTRRSKGPTARNLFKHAPRDYKNHENACSARESEGKTQEVDKCRAGMRNRLHKAQQEMF